MKFATKIMLSITLLTSSFTAYANPMVAKALSPYAWEKRQILLFAPNEQDENYQAFIADVATQPEAFADRRLQVWSLVAGQSVRLDQKTLPTKLMVSDFQGAYGVEDGEFRVILIGYDQGEKLRQDNVDVERIFAEIDQMPMRVQEMRRQSADTPE